MKLVPSLTLVMTGFAFGVLVGMHRHEEPTSGVVSAAAGSATSVAASTAARPPAPGTTSTTRPERRRDGTVPRSAATGLLQADDGAMTLRPASEVLRRKLDAIVDGAGREHRPAFANPVAAWRTQFESDAPSSEWSAMAEAQLASYLSSFGMSDVEIVAVSCRESICELQAASTSGDNAQQASLEWQSLMSNMSNADWWATYSLGAPNTAIMGGDDGRTLIISYISRAQES